MSRSDSLVSAVLEKWIRQVKAIVSGTSTLRLSDRHVISRRLTKPSSGWACTVVTYELRGTGIPRLVDTGKLIA